MGNCTMFKSFIKKDKAPTKEVQQLSISERSKTYPPSNSQSISERMDETQQTTESELDRLRRENAQLKKEKEQVVKEKEQVVMELKPLKRDREIEEDRVLQLKTLKEWCKEPFITIVPAIKDSRTDEPLQNSTLSTGYMPVKNLKLTEDDTELIDNEDDNKQALRDILASKNKKDTDKAKKLREDIAKSTFLRQQIQNALVLKEWSKDDFVQYVTTFCHPLTNGFLDQKVDNVLLSTLFQAVTPLDQESREKIIEEGLTRKQWLILEVMFRSPLNKDMATVFEFFRTQHKTEAVGSKTQQFGKMSVDHFLCIKAIAESFWEFCCIMEVKANPVLTEMDSLVAWIKSALYDENHCVVRQEYTYLAMHRVSFGIIYSGKRIAFLSFLPPSMASSGGVTAAAASSTEKWELHITPFFDCESSEEPVWELFIRFILSAKFLRCKRHRYPGYRAWLEHRGFYKPDDPDSDGDDDDDKDLDNLQKLKHSMFNTNQETSTTTTAKSGGVNEELHEFSQVTCADLMDERCWDSQYDYLEDDQGRYPDDAIILRDTECSMTFRKVIRGKDMVIKQIPLDRLYEIYDEEVADRIANQAKKEKRIYQLLDALKGIVIPTLYYAGVMLQGMFDCVCTSYEGENIEKVESITEVFIEECKAALKSIHGLNVLHGDIAERNILVHPITKKPVIIDFDRSSVCFDKDAKEKELNMLDVLLRNKMAKYVVHEKVEELTKKRRLNVVA